MQQLENLGFRGISTFLVKILELFKNSVLLKLVLGDMAGVAYFITGHEQTRLN